VAQGNELPLCSGSIATLCTCKTAFHSNARDLTVILKQLFTDDVVVPPIKMLEQMTCLNDNVAYYYFFTFKSS